MSGEGEAEARRGEAEARRGEAEAEAEARRGEATGARRGGSRGGAAATPRRPRAAGIKDAFNWLLLRWHLDR